jgi:hypothetical protein
MTTPKTDRRLPAIRLLRRSDLNQWDVAHEAGVSQAMVSLVLNGHVHSDAVDDALRTLLGDNFTEAEIFGGES